MPEVDLASADGCTSAPASVCHNHGYYAIGGPRPDNLDSFLHHFARNGYRTAAYGKVHVPDNPTNWFAEGIDEWADTLNGPDGTKATAPYREYLREVGCDGIEDHDVIREIGNHPHHWDARPSKVPLEHCVEAWINRKATDFIGALGEDESFCIHCSYPHPHHCLTPDKRFWDAIPEDVEPPQLWAENAGRPPNFRKMADYGREGLEWHFEPKTIQAGAKRVWRATLALILQNDHFFGELFDFLKAKGRWDDTIIVFHDDHGAYHGIYGVMEKAPGICSDAVCRVPSVWKVPGNTPGVRQQLIEHVDLAPTLCSACGLPPMDAVDGIDLSAVLRDPEAPTKKVAVSEWPWSKAIRWDKWRLVHYHRDMYDGEDVGELYDMEVDPWEQNNLYADPDHQDIVNEGLRLLLEWLTDTTRITTMWPYLPEDMPAFRCQEPFDLGCDGKEKRGKGPRARLEKGNIGAFAVGDYL